MKILIKGAVLVDRQSPHHLKSKNVLIQNGRISDIGDKSYSADKTIEASGMYLTPGWFDLGAAGGDPGHENREDLASLARSAAAGGFTEVAVLPNTHPVIQTKNEVAYIRQGNDGRLVQLHALAAVTRNTKGEELTEMIDLHEAGAVGFTDGLQTLWHTDIFLKALQYLQKFNGVLIDRPEDTWLTRFGQMHEGVQSTMLGLKGMPRTAEEIALVRNLELLVYAGGRYHAASLSSGRSIELIRQARKKGLNVTAGVNAYQPLLGDELLADFDTNYKVNPPLREKADQEAIIKGLKDKTITVIASGHVPVDEEGKVVEFDQAEWGMINHQTVAMQLAQLARLVPVEDLLEALTYGPREALNLEVPPITEEAKANLTLFDPNAEWTLNEDSCHSKSKNSPWWGKKITGRSVAVFNNGRQFISL